ncbi:hypothetical protein LB503_005028 [Fusarium chuoi]|nr:hypothetical protein LB503_005028 [Fusarium chuoi]
MSSQNSITTVELSEQERYFDKICDASHNYPQTAPSSRRSTKARQAVATTWNREAARIFHPRPENAYLKIFETCDCMTPCNCRSLSGDVKTMKDLLLRLQPNKKAPKMRYVVLESVPQSFSSSLEVLTMLIDWCDDDWIFYINELFDGIKPLVDKARTPAIKDESALTKDMKIITGLAESPSKRLSHMTSLETGTTRSQSNEKEDPWGDLNDRVKRLERLEVFSFDELQKLQQGLETIQEALLVLKLNNQVIKQIREHYQCLMTQYRLPALKGIKKDARSRSYNILNALLLLVKESKEMYNTILQYKTIQINKIYAESAHLSTRNMENIANKTKRETSSMHIITFVTLIFLPGTFMASFFQSGILEWPQVNAKAPWRLNKEIFSLFFGLSATITIVTIVVWMIILFMLRRPQSERVKHAP